MDISNTTLLSLSLILLLGLFIPELFKRLRLPFVTSLIIIGAIIGPHGFAYLQTNEVIEFFGFLGFTFLMFMAGLETRFKHLRKHLKKILILAITNSLIPFLTGLAIARYFNYGWTEALLLGTIFTSSSVAIIVPTLKSAKILAKKEGQIMLTSVLLQDIASLVLLAVMFQKFAPISPFSIPVYLGVLVASIIILQFLIPAISRSLFKHKFFGQADNEEQLRYVIFVLVIVLAFFSFIGVHPILGAFLVGMLLSDVLTSRIILRKIHTLGYGLFVPIFFVIAGSEFDFAVFRKLNFQDFVIPSIVLGLILSKFLSGYLGGRLVKLSKTDAITFGISSTIQLTTTLAAAFAANAIGLLDSTLVSGILMLATVTTIFAPILLRFYPQRVTKEQLQETKKEQAEIIPTVSQLNGGA